MPTKFLLLGGGGFWVFLEGGGGGSANFIFMGVGIFPIVWFRGGGLERGAGEPLPPNLVGT